MYYNFENKRFGVAFHVVIVIFATWNQQNPENIKNTPQFHRMEPPITQKA